jgi:chromosomal replication initiation ATPase DnaA
VEQIKKKKMRKRKKEKRKKNKKCMSKNKISELPSIASRLKDPYSFSNHVQSDNEDFLCASGSLFAICTCPPISSVCIFLFPSLT